VVCVPEAFLSGYTRDAALARERAVSLSSPGFQAVCQQLSRHPATVILGLIETDGGQLFNTAAVITAGRLVGTQRKRHLVEDCFRPGRSLRVFDAGSVRFGIGICSDARDEQDAMALAQKGASAIFYLLNNMLEDPIADRWRERHAIILQDRARQARVSVLSADVVGRREHERSYGCSIAVSPTGVITDRVNECTTGNVTARIPPNSTDPGAPNRG
jgi:predicted amidohydrolase